MDEGRVPSGHRAESVACEACHRAAAPFDAAAGTAGVPLCYGKDPRQWAWILACGRDPSWRLLSSGSLTFGGAERCRRAAGQTGTDPAKALQRAYQRDPEAIEKWRRETFPNIARQAKAAGGEVYFWDKSGFRANPCTARHGARKGGRLSSNARVNGNRSAPHRR